MRLSTPTSITAPLSVRPRELPCLPVATCLDPRWTHPHRLDSESRGQHVARAHVPDPCSIGDVRRPLVRAPVHRRPPEPTFPPARSRAPTPWSSAKVSAVVLGLPGRLRLPMNRERGHAVRKGQGRQGRRSMLRTLLTEIRPVTGRQFIAQPGCATQAVHVTSLFVSIPSAPSAAKAATSRSTCGDRLTIVRDPRKDLEAGLLSRSHDACGSLAPSRAGSSRAVSGPPAVTEAPHSTIASVQSRSRKRSHGRIRIPSLVRPGAASLQTTMA